MRRSWHNLPKVEPPLQRALRNVHVATQHMMVNDATYELTGRLLLGVPTQVNLL